MKTVQVPATLTGELVAKRILFLAYEASSPMGMGFLHYKPDGVSEDQLWQEQRGGFRPCNVGGQDIYADYAHGRMMKLWGFSFTADSVTFDDERVPQSDYQSWCGRYPTNEALVTAAIESLR